MLYINDIVDVVKDEDDLGLHLFADDTLVYGSSGNIELLVTRINSVLNEIELYCRKNLLQVNKSKTKYNVIGKENIRQSFLGNLHTVMVGSEALDSVTKIKYLGVIIDNKMSFKEHCNLTISKISYGINHLGRCSHSLSKWSKLVVFNTLVLPHFTYCATILYMLQQNEINRLQKMQNRAMRIILTCDKYTAIKSMLRQLQWLPVQEFFRYNVLVFIFKMRIGDAPSYLRNKLTVNNQVHDHDTRQQQNFYIPRRSKKLAANSVFFRGLDDFNKLPNDIKNSSSLENFKRNLKLFLLSENDLLVA